MAHLCDDYFASAAALLAQGMVEGVPVLAIFQFTENATVDDIYAALKTVGDDHYVSRVGISHQAGADQAFEALVARMRVKLDRDPDSNGCDHG